MLGCVPASVAFEPRSNNKKKGGLGGISGGRKITRPVGVIVKLEIAGVN